MQKIHLVCDSHHGQYLPKIYSEKCADFLKSGGISESDIVELQNPDGGFYWDTWETVLNKFKYADETGAVWSLYQDGDLFLIAFDLLNDEEKAEFFGDY